MTASVLGCGSRKDLVARFRSVNPRTDCTLDRLHKWLQGRALPRGTAVLDDWAKVLGSKRAGAWLAACALTAFAGELGARFGGDAETLLAAPPFAGRGTRATPAAAATPRVSGVRYLCGAYACYSPAWSPYQRGKLIRGSLVIAPGRGTALAATYAETLLGRTVRLVGTPIVARGSLHMNLQEEGGDLPLFFSVFLPRPPAGVLCGVMSGVTLIGPEPEPSATRIAMIRVAVDAPLEATNRYIIAAEGAIAADLTALGLALADRAAVDRLALRFLGADSGASVRLDQVASAEQAALAAQLDPLHLAAAQ